MNSRAQSYDLSSPSTVVKTGTQRTESTNYRKIAIVLSVVSFVLMKILIVFITLYALKVSSQTERSNEPATVKPVNGKLTDNFSYRGVRSLYPAIRG